MEVTFLQNLAIERQALVLLLMLPVVATIVGIARHLIGLKSLGLYAPIILTFSLYGLGLNGNYGEYSDVVTSLKFGLIFILIMAISCVLGSSILRRSRMHYFPKVAIVVSLAAIMLLLSIIGGELIFRRGFSSINAFSLVMVASVAEQLTSTLFKEDIKKSLFLTLETVFTSVCCYILIAWPSFQDFLVLHPYLILVTFIVNYFVGKYRGLRFREYFRFNEVLKINDED
jgi:hypothetical protein